MKGSQGRNTSYEPRGKNWSRRHGGMHLAVLLPLAFSVCFCTQPRANDPLRGGSTYIGLGLATSINNQEIAYRSIWWRHFLNLGSLFQDDPVLCLLNKEQSESPCIKKIKIVSDNSKLPLSIYPPGLERSALYDSLFFFPLKSPECKFGLHVPVNWTENTLILLRMGPGLISGLSWHWSLWKNGCSPLDHGTREGIWGERALLVAIIVATSLEGESQANLCQQ